MDKIYNHKDIEEKIYQEWENAGYFTPRVDKKKKPFTIILPPPNANGDLHFGHAMFVIEDILVRYNRMRDIPTLWLSGADHAGFETQFVFEKKLEKEGKSRLDFSRETLYQMIWDFSQGYRPIMENQLRKLGFSLDWTRGKFTLDPDIIKIVYKTFKKMYDDGLMYRGDRLVNYCTRCGTSFSDLEVNHKEQKDPLYYIKYGPFVLATVRPETKFGDTAVAVNPKDKRYTKWVGKIIEVEGAIGKFKVVVVADDAIDPKFGTGVAKITPAHDMKDFEIGKRHSLATIRVIDFDGRLNERAGKYKGLYVKQARKIIAQDMQKMGLIERVDGNYTHTIEVCYKCGTTIEPMLLPQWFVRMESLAKLAINAVKDRQIRIFPKQFEKIYFQFLENIRDWNISRQIVWGIRIPAWQCEDCKEWTITEGKTPLACSKCNAKKLKQDEDTLDTWFSSAQWPFATLQTTNKGDFEYFYPTSVMETGYEILRWWVARMVMVGLYVTGKVPFERVVLHGMVRDPYGKKMSKSKGNVVNPLELIDGYGADAVRTALVYGTALGNDQALSYPKLQAMRNFTNKLWNIGRFIVEFKSEDSAKGISNHKDDKAIIQRLNDMITTVSEALDQYRLHDGAEALYSFIWHEFADTYIESTKERRAEAQPVLEYVFRTSLELLHPFMPFITEELWRRLPNGGKSIMISPWPKAKT